jgi:hypothetical protein
MPNAERNHRHDNKQRVNASPGDTHDKQGAIKRKTQECSIASQAVPARLKLTESTSGMPPAAVRETTGEPDDIR